jgi:hypothetical protein
MLLYSPRWLFLHPGILLVFGGLAVGLWVLPAPRTVGGVTFDVHTLFFAAIAVVLGVQAVAFAVLSRTYAEATGLLPTSRWLARLRRVIRFRTVLLVGVLLAIGGLAGAIYGVTLWGTKGFGPIDPRHVFRVVIPSGLAMCVGVQIILSGFFASMLRLHVRPRNLPTGREAGESGATQ